MILPSISLFQEIIYHLRKTRVELLEVLGFFSGSAVCDSKISACYILVCQFLTFLVKLQDNIFFLGTR